jgi:tetratricopeptide (TPR) repeat protein
MELQPSVGSRTESQLLREMTSERTVTRLVRQRRERGGSLVGGGPPFGTHQLSTALLTLLGSRPLTGGAIFEVVLERGARPSYGRLVAREAAVRLGIPESALASGGNFTERVEPILRVLRSLGLLEPVSTSVSARGRPIFFRLGAEHVDLLQGILSAYRSGKGLPWVEGDAPVEAVYLLDRARRLTWEREFDRAESVLRLTLRELDVRPRSQKKRVANSVLRAEVVQVFSSVARYRGTYRVAMTQLDQAAKTYRSLSRRNPERPDLALGFATASLTLAELSATLGHLLEARHRVRAAEQVYDRLSRTRLTDWSFVRQLALSELISGEIWLLEGDPRRALGALDRADLRLGQCQGIVPGDSGPVPANLSMNRSRVTLVRAIALECIDKSPEALKAGAKAMQHASSAVRQSEGRNAVILRRLGSCVRVRLELMKDDAIRKQIYGLIATGERSFDRSEAIVPKDPDTLFERARFEFASVEALSRFGPSPQLSRSRRAARQASRRALGSSTDHPARSLDPRLTSGSTNWRTRGYSGSGNIAAAMLPSG